MVLLERIRQVLGVTTQKRGPLYGATCAAAGAAAASIVWLAGVGVFYASTRSAETDDATTVAAGPIAPPPKVPANADGVVAIEGMKGRIRFGEATEGIKVPSEQNKISLPAYVIEPPDILRIAASRVVHKLPHLIQPSDVLQIQIAGSEATGRSGGSFKRFPTVDSAGRIDLGSRYPGKIKVGGLTEDDAAKVVQDALVKYVEDPQVSVHFAMLARSLQPISGEHLVAPDGRVNLGTYGQVYVAGMTLEGAKAAIDAQLAGHLDKPDVSVSVFAYNSKVYYVITEGAETGDTVARFPITGNETVLDALTQVNGLSRVSNKRIWIARPMPGGSATDTILPVNWEEITKGGSTTSNYQVFPGDRIFISDDPPPTKPAAEDMNQIPMKQPLGEIYQQP